MPRDTYTQNYRSISNPVLPFSTLTETNTLSEAFLNLVNQGNQHHQLEVVDKLCTPAFFLYGGTSLAAAIEVAEKETQRPLIWMTNQYISYAHPGDTVDVKLNVIAPGRNVTQVQVQGFHGDRLIFTAQGSMGKRGDNKLNGQWVKFPDVPPPDQVKLAKGFQMETDRDHVNRHMQYRYVDSWYNSKQTESSSISEQTESTLEKNVRCWSRLPGTDHSETSTLALLADIAPSSISPKIGRRGGGSSLDNSLRLVKPTATEWVLLDMQVHGMYNGMGHVTTNMWSEDGTLMAVAGQSFVVRTFDGI